MKSRLCILVSLLLVAALFIAGCSGGGSGDDDVDTQEKLFNEWVSKAEVWPDWAEEKAPAGYGAAPTTDLLINSYSNSRVSHKNTVQSIKEFRYIINNEPDFEHMTLTKLLLGDLLERVREDHMAYKQIDAVKQSGKTEDTITLPGYGDYTIKFDEVMERPLLAIYSRNGFTDKMEEIIAEMDADEHHLPGDHLSEIARAYYVAGMEDEALDRLAIVGDETKFSYGQKMSSTTVGAASLAYRMGEYQKVIDFTQWMIDEGLDSSRFRSDLDDYAGGGESYYDDQWQSSYKQVEAWRALAQEKNPVNFSDLTDGDYNITTQGYRGTIDFTVTIADGKLSSTVVDPGHSEDRTYAGLEIIPKDWANKQSYVVDGMTGATVTSGAAEMALIKAMQAADNN